ncbi:hypothetical protein [Alcaligenes aquatilis]|uniref:hypothetical protein n=1 Tax=Alcaligenes aquatilis TaxID=323284 RepID=UPI00360D5833
MTMLRISLTVGLLWVSASALAANGQENARLGRVHVQADSIEMLGADSLKASGNVVVIGKDSVIHSQEALISQDGSVIQVQAVQSGQSHTSEFDPLSLQDARAAGGEMRLQREGYVAVKTKGLSTTWWNRATQTCVMVKTSQGRYSEVKVLAASVCMGS